MTAYGALAGRHETSAQIMSTGAALQDNQRPVRGAHFHAGRVSPVANRARSRLCQRAPRPPEPNTHGYSLLTQLLELRFRFLQPQSHFHFPHHRDTVIKMFLRQLQIAASPVKLSQANVAMRDERAHAEGFSEGESLVIVIFGAPDVRPVFVRRDLA